ncbi:helix-turn-helix domain-containing protein [Pyxidicoccus parkwayensis]|uniref:Helix-turn-helix domain-containing protein n=2 Tax=Pyxidicoccus parkwayensis TaxID=2813578 RepID=A0ABX7PCQ0_9BACT|nr:helix-turn-helix domain-containing protein [Pyxidicoccus parkwaysis]
MPSRTIGLARDGEPNLEEVLGPREVPSLLRLEEKTVYAMAIAGEMPAFKLRGQWRIRRKELERWMDEQPRGGGNDDA